MTIIECKDAINELRSKCAGIIDTAKAEVRDLTEDEENQICELKDEIEAKKEELEALKRELDEKLPKDEDKDEKDEDKEENKRNKNTSIRKMKNYSLVKEIRSALSENKKSIFVPAETRAVQVQGGEGVHDAVVETEIEGILEPLYANSVLSKLGARWYTGLPKGDVQIPVMSGSTVKWEGEIDEADGTSVGFTTVKLSPKRLSAYVDISKQLINQDTIGVEAAIRRDIVNALNDKLEATLFGNGEGTTDIPAGLFYNVSETSVTDYKGVCEFEAEVEENNIFGDMKYVMSPAAKAAFRSMIKGTNATGMVYENGEMDGIEAYVTTNVAKDKFVYGNFNNLVCGSWGDIELTLDPYTQATKGCLRLVINAYFDFKPARTVAFNFGTVEAADEPAEPGQD